jgi:hypothetical protein
MDHPFDLDLLAHRGAVRGSSQTTCALAGLHRLLWRRSVNPDVVDVVPQLRERLFVAVERLDYDKQVFLRRARITVEDLIDLCAPYGPSWLLNPDRDLQIPHGRRISILV